MRKKIANNLIFLTRNLFFVCIFLFFIEHMTAWHVYRAIPYPLILTCMVFSALTALLLYLRLRQDIADIVTPYIPHAFIISLLLTLLSSIDLPPFATLPLLRGHSIISALYPFTYPLTLLSLSALILMLTLPPHSRRIPVRAKKKTISRSSARKKHSIRIWVRIIQWHKTQGLAHCITLYGIVIAGIIVRILSAIIGDIDLDEGIHLYDARLISEGQVPFRDFLGREPYYLYTLSLVVKLFGANLLVSRLLSVATTVGTTLTLYAIGKKLFSKNTGLLIAGIFSLSPAIIFHTYLGNLYAVYLFLLALCTLFFVMTIQKPSTALALAFGVLSGVAVHFYRLHIFFLFSTALLLGMLGKKSLRHKPFWFFYTALSIPYLLPIGYFSLVSGYANMEIMYGNNELVLAYLLLPALYGIGSLYDRISSYIRKQKNILFSLVSLGIATYILYAFFSIGLKPDLKEKIIFDALLQHWHFLFFTLVGIIIVFKKWINVSPRLFAATVIIGCITLLIIAYQGTQEAQALQNFGARIIPLTQRYFFLALLTLSLACVIIVSNSQRIKITAIPTEVFAITVLFFSPTVFYLQHTQWSVGNVMSYYVLGSIFAGLGAWYVWQYVLRLSPATKVAVSMLFALLLLAPIHLYTTTTLRDRLWTQELRKELNTYLRKHTQEREEIFTNALVSVVETNRRAVLDISRTTIYSDSPLKHVPKYINHAKNLISDSQLAPYIRDHVPTLLVDHRTKKILKDNPAFAQLQTSYEIVKEWPQYEMAVWHAVPSSIKQKKVSHPD